MAFAKKDVITMGELKARNGTVVPVVKEQFLKFTITGEPDSPLLCNCRDNPEVWQNLEDSAGGKARPKKKEDRDFTLEFCRSLYWKSPKPTGHPTEEDIKKGVFGFPWIGVKKSISAAYSHVKGVTKKQADGGFYVPDGWATIISDEIPQPKRAPVPIPGAKQGSTIAWYAQFNRWSIVVILKYGRR